MRDHSPLSPEERRKRLATMRAAFGTEVEEKLKPRLTAWEVVKRVAIGVYNDGFIHAGNLAYLAICAQAIKGVSEDPKEDPHEGVFP